MLAEASTGRNWKGVRPAASAFTIFGSLNSILWIRLKSVAGAEYARLNTGGSIIRGNSGNGALPTLNGKNGGNKNIAANDPRSSRIAVLMAAANRASPE